MGSQVDQSAASAWSRDRIERFLAEEKLKYQKIDLPFGLSTAGNDRKRMFEIAFEGDLAGKSVLHVGSCLGAFCIEAMRRHAGAAVGVEIDSERIRHARTLTEICGHQVEYIAADLDRLRLDRSFDVCLCLNVLHHLRDPLGMLYHLTDIARERLVLEIAAFGAHDRKRMNLSPLTAALLKRREAIYVAEASPEEGNQRFFFSPSAIVRILQDHIKKYWKIESFATERDRFAVRATKLRIDRLTLVSGLSAAGKSVLMGALKNGEFDGMLGSSAVNPTAVLSAQKIAEGRFSDLFPTNPVSHLIYHYDTTRPLKYNFHSFSRDLALDLVDCAKAIDIIIVAPRAATLRQQMSTSKIAMTKGDKMEVRKRILEYYERDGWIASHYSQWFDYCAAVKGQHKRIFAYVEAASGRELRPIATKQELLGFIKG
jgi:SAM-dependent methyltransferase